MQLYVYDIEANGLLPDVDTVHCIAIQDPRTYEMWSYGPAEINDAIDKLNEADVLIGHNIIGYDNRVLSRLYPKFKPKAVIDTLIWARIIHPDRTQLPCGLDRHSLEAWGKYLGGQQKAQYTGGWSAFSQEMLDYCIQDVRTNTEIYWHLDQKTGTDQSILSARDTEQQVADICMDIELTGFGFDAAMSQNVVMSLTLQLSEIEMKLQESFPTIVNERFHKTTGRRLKDEVIEFNASSSKQWAFRLQEKYGWKPATTDAGNPIVDEATLKGLDYPEAALGLQYRDISKKLGMILDWQQRFKCDMITHTPRIHGRINSQGTATGRASHSGPNLAQVPSDPLCRRLFVPYPGNRMVGCDLSGIELRCLAHYMHRYDNGQYADIILNGDIHTENQKAAGLPTRNDAKTFIYALIYGAGDAKIGQIVGGSRKDGADMKQRFFDRIPALRRLITDVQAAAKSRGNIKLLDGRRIPIRAEHKALNSLLQGAGALISKYWLMNTQAELVNMDAHLVGWIHDELQVDCKAAVADEVGLIMVEQAAKAGTMLNFNMPVDAEYSVGWNWSETH